jgi:SAM-dependent methyltransferase
MKQAPDADEGFSADWLGLREAFDSEARDVAAQQLRLVDRLQRWRAGMIRPWHVIDLGCGTGSNLRWLAPRLGGAQQWLAVDHDAALLNAWPAVFDATGTPLVNASGDLEKVAHWPSPSAPVQIVRRQMDLAEHLEALPWQHADLVTGSALIDLVGQPWLKRLVTCCIASQASVLLTLSVDGRHLWEPADRDDQWVSRAFASHQQRDKGFGPALGARAVPALVQLLREAGYRVFQARSDWRVHARQRAQGQALMDAMAEGMSQAVQQQKPVAAERARAWQARRQAGSWQAQLTVGHIDVLALPPSRSA